MHYVIIRRGWREKSDTLTGRLTIRSAMRIATTATRTIGAASSSFRITAVPAYHLAARAKSTSTATALDDKPGPSTSSTVRASAVESSDDYSSVIPQLPRPLGISIPPVSASKTYTKSRDSFHDAERSKAERKALYVISPGH